MARQLSNDEKLRLVGDGEAIVKLVLDYCREHKASRLTSIYASALLMAELIESGAPGGRAGVLQHLNGFLDLIYEAKAELS